MPFDRSRLLTWEQLHEITIPYCTRVQQCLTIIHKWFGGEKLYLLPNVQGVKWYKPNVTNIWLN